MKGAIFSSGCARAVLIVISKQPVIDYEELSLRADCSVSSVKRAVKTLESEGWIERRAGRGGGRGAGIKSEYALTEYAQAHIMIEKMFKPDGLS